MLFCGTLATVFRVQCSLILISLHLLPKEIVSTLTGIYQLQNKGNDVFKQTAHSDYFFNFLHIMRFRTRKHKRQNLIFKSNWRSVLNRISNFRTKYKFHACTDRSKQTEREESDKTDNLMPVSTRTDLIQLYFVFSLCVISLPGLLIIIYLIVPKLQSFCQFLYNLSEDWLEKMVLSHSNHFSKHHYLYVLSVIFGNMAINSFCTTFLIENYST